MAEFFTAIGFTDFGEPNPDTDVNTNSHRSVRSYKTLRAAELAIETGTKAPDTWYRILWTRKTRSGWVSSWVDEVWPEMPDNVCAETHWKGRCTTCGQLCHWQSCPTGGWWHHHTHPEDGHDADLGWQPEQDMDDRGHYFTVGAYISNAPIQP